MTGAHGDEVVDVRQDRLPLHEPQAAAVGGRERTVLAAARATATCLHVAGQAELSPNRQPRVAVERREPVLIRNKVALSHPLRGRVREQLPHHVDLVVAREDLNAPLLAGLVVPFLNHLRVPLEDVRQSPRREDPLPQGVGLDPVRVRRVAGAVVLAPVERPERQILVDDARFISPPTASDSRCPRTSAHPEAFQTLSLRCYGVREYAHTIRNLQQPRDPGLAHAIRSSPDNHPSKCASMKCASMR